MSNSCFFRMISVLSFFFSGLILFGQTEDGPAPKGWPPEAKTIYYLSAADKTMQPAVFYDPGKSDPVPLLVGLHSWSGDYRQINAYYLKEAKKRGWAMIFPNFRGPNWTPEGCGSDLAVEDIVSAVEYMKKRLKIDTSRIYLMGSSGGGYASMLMAGRHPEIWAGVCSWCGISDLADWYHETKAQDLPYSKHLEKACGGAPGTSPQIDEQYRHRSAITWGAGAKGVPLSLNHGIHDGHRKSSVPLSQSVRLFNKIAPEEKRVREDQIRWMVEKETIPPELQKENEIDPLFGTSTVHFRRTAGNVRITIFEGGHSSVPAAGIEWLSRQKKGTPADWSVSEKSVKADQTAIQK
ncbi:MAG: prolyl oligopeptidase family serine peptidase [Planctomycetia bacterium]|nr:prolyl oligopeptidase family serine peptidase [Planctomycetia bacterium]